MTFEAIRLHGKVRGLLLRGKEKRRLFAIVCRFKQDMSREKQRVFISIDEYRIENPLGPFTSLERWPRAEVRREIPEQVRWQEKSP